MFVVGHLYIEKRSTRIPTIHHAVQAFVLWTNPCNDFLIDQTAHR
jgi:hypothetical protein